MSTRENFRSVGRFLYSQNPFYLISCFLVLYGLQSHADSGTEIAARSANLAAWIAGYSVLMAVVVIAVVRVCHVWQDARSIFLVVIIGFVCLSWSIDEWYVIGDMRATLVMLAGFVLSVVTSEIAIRVCGMRFSGWYRLSYYGLLLVFFAVPSWLGFLVSIRNRSITPWSGMIFSSAIACATLLLIPAMRRRVLLTRHSGTPWKWPLYPLSAFGMLWVLAGMRSHAVWTAFAFKGPDVRFEPLLLLPIAWALLILIAESNLGRRRQPAVACAMFLAPLLAILGLPHSGESHLPFHGELVYWTGSTVMLALVATLAFYVYLRFRGATNATLGVIASLILMSLFGTMPLPLEQMGLELWMLGAVAWILQLAWTLGRVQSSLAWSMFGGTGTLVICMGCNSYNLGQWSAVATGGFALVSMLIIGALFDSPWAAILRRAAALSIAAGSLLTVVASFQWPADRSLWTSATALTISLGYLLWVKRIGWFYVLAWNAAAVFFITGHSAYDYGFFDGLNAPFQIGVVFLIVGFGITMLKSERLDIARLMDRGKRQFKRWQLGF